MTEGLGNSGEKKEKAMSLIDLVRQLEGPQYCERDGFPLIEVGGQVYCSVEYADGLIGGQRVIGVASGDNGLELLFSNGNSIPLTEPGSGEPLIARPGMLPDLRALLIGRKLEGFRHGEWVSDEPPRETHPVFALQFSGEEPREHRTLEVSLESVRRIRKGRGARG